MTRQNTNTPEHTTGPRVIVRRARVRGRASHRSSVTEGANRTVRVARRAIGGARADDRASSARSVREHQIVCQHPKLSETVEFGRHGAHR